MNKNKGIAPLVLMIILAILLVSGYIGYRYFFPAQNLCWPYCQNMTDQDREDIKKSALETQTSDWKTYRNDKYGFEFQYSPDNWISVDDVGAYLLNKETNFERLVTLVKKSPLNGKQCTNENNGKPITCNSTLESIITIAVINKTINDVKLSIPSYALTEYDGHTGYNSTCAPLSLTTYSGKRPSLCAFSGFEWDEHAEYFYPIGSKTLVVNWNYLDVDKNVYLTSEKNFLDIMNTFKFTK